MYKFYFFILCCFFYQSISFAAEGAGNTTYVMPAKGIELYQSGVDHLKKKRFLAAETSFKASLEIQPVFAPAWLGLTEIAYSKGQLALAGEYLNNAQAIDSSNTDVDVQLTVGRFHYLLGQFNKSEKALVLASTLKPNSSKIYVDLGDLYLYSLHKPIKAEIAFNKAIKLNPKLGGAHFGYAKALMEQKRYSDSNKSFLKAAELNPEKHHPYWGLMELNLVQKQYKQAQKELNKAIELSPRLGRLKLKRADIYFQIGDKDKAVTIYKTVAEYKNLIDEKYSAIESYQKLGAIYQADKLYSKAELAYRNALKYNSELPIALNNLAQIIIEQQQKERYTQAIEWAQKANVVSPKTATILDTLAWLSHLKGDDKQAIKYLLEAVGHSKNHLFSNYHLGLLLYNAGQKSMAKEYLQRALILDQNFEGANKAQSILDSL